MCAPSVSLQCPQLEVTDFDDLDRPFLGGAIASRSLLHCQLWCQRLDP